MSATSPPGARMAKPALDVGLVTANAEPLIAFYAGVAGGTHKSVPVIQ